jgi:hypothetical protein
MHISTPKVNEKNIKNRKKKKMLLAAPVASKAIFKICSRKTAASWEWARLKAQSLR